MTAQIIDGKHIAADLRQNLKKRVDKRLENGLRRPGLAVILVGEDPASEVYVRNKRKGCEEAGIESIAYDLDSDTSQEKLLSIIDELNDNETIDGILVQFPVPGHIDTETVIERIRPDKDVDGFHPYNVGKMVSNLDSFLPATPFGVMRMFEEYGIKIIGKNVCIIGSSDIVGKPMASLLINAKATVTVCNSKTEDLKAHTLAADIVIIAVGVPHLLKANMIQEGAVVIDVGINRLDTGKLTGDADFEDCKEKASFITPVPGGVGPMTIGMLLKNTVKAAYLREKRENK